MVSLRSSHLKLARARQHLDELSATADEYMAEFVPAIIEEATDVPEGRALEFFLHFPDPDAHMGILLGDFLANARSALDHLVFSLSDNSAKTQFPISTSRTRYLKVEKGRASMRDGSLAGVPAAARHVIDGMQPFTWAPEERSRHPFALLADLNNADKHNALQPSINLVRDVRIELHSRYLPSGPMTVVMGYEEPGLTVSGKTQIVGLGLVDVPFDSITPHAYYTRRLVFGEGSAEMSEFESVYEAVSNALAAFSGER